MSHQAHETLQAMQPKKEIPQAELFRMRLEQMIDLTHPLCKLSHQIDWSVFEREFGPLYVDKQGRPGKPIRLLVGLHYLKHMFDCSDEVAVNTFLENPYWQYFCGMEHFVHAWPLNPTTLVKWRRRVGAEGIERLLAETLASARRSGQLRVDGVSRVNVDTTVQPKAISYPTDARLYQKMRQRLVAEARTRGIELRQSYEQVGKRALTSQGRVLRDIERKVEQPDAQLQSLLQTAQRLLDQQRNDHGKLYSVWAPEVECIAKGKAHQRYEFGVKVTVATTSRDNWIVGVDALHGNPYDGHTLHNALQQVQRLTAQTPAHAYCDRGYRGHGVEGDTQVHISGSKRIEKTRSALRWMKRRQAIEPVIGHLKSDHRMDRNHLHGPDGDRINAMLAAAAFNLRKLARAFLCHRFFEAIQAVFHHLDRANFIRFLPLPQPKSFSTTPA